MHPIGSKPVASNSVGPNPSPGVPVKKDPVDVVRQRTARLSQEALSSTNAAQQGTASTSLIGRGWRHIKSFFSAATSAITSFFRKILGSSKVVDKVDPTPQLPKDSSPVKDGSPAKASVISAPLPTAPKGASPKQTTGPETPFSTPSATPVGTPFGTPAATPHASPKTTGKPLLTAPPAPVGAPVVVPSGVPNRNNSCYRIASNQALRAIDAFMGVLWQPLERRADETAQEYSARGAVRQAIINLTDLLDHRAPPDEIEKADIELSVAVACSDFDSEFNLSNLDVQQDAAAYVGLVLSSVLRQNHEMEVVLTGKEGELEITSNPQREVFSVLPVALPDDDDNLQSLVDANFGTHVEYNPVDPWQAAEGVSFATYARSVTLTSAPQDYLAIQLKRSVYSPEAIQRAVAVKREETEKSLGLKLSDAEEAVLVADLFDLLSQSGIVNDKPIKFPQGDVLDFSLAHGMPKGTLNYNLKGFVCHLSGFGANSGHYISYANKHGQWYKYNDNEVKAVAETEVAGAKEQACLVFFER